MDEEQKFYLSTNGRLPKELTLIQLKELCRIAMIPGATFSEPVTIGTRWQEWPICS